MGSLLPSVPQGVRNGGQRMSKKRAKTNDRKEEEGAGENANERNVIKEQKPREK